MSVKFGAFELDAAHRTLLRDGERVPITAKVFDTLVVLVNNRGRVVEKSELLEVIWPDAVVEEATLFQTVSMLRKTLGCSRGDGPRFIATIPGRGYQFVGDVEVCEPPAATDDVPAQAAPPVQIPLPPPEVRRRFSSRHAAALLLLAAASLAVWLVPLTFQPASARITTRPEPLTSYPGREIFPAFSPDDDRIAFMWEGAGRDNWDIYIKDIGGKHIGRDSPRRLTSHPGADWSPAWSPDGRTIAFVRRNMEAGTQDLVVVPAAGGPENTLLTGPLSRNIAVWNQLARLVTWHPDGEHLIVSHADQPGKPFFLHSVSLKTGRKKQLTTWPAAIDGDMDPAVSPDGRRLAFRRKVEGWNSDVYTLGLTPELEPEGEPALVGPRMFSPAWLPDGKGLIAVKSPARPGLWRLPASGVSDFPPVQLEQPVEGAFPAISKSGDRAAFSTIQVRTDIWEANLHGDPRPRPLLASTYIDIVPEYSPDGKRIAFTSYRSGNQEIWTCNRDGSNPVQLTYHRTVDADCPVWSPDGSLVAYHANQDGFRDVFVVSARGGTPRRLTNRQGLDVPPSWSRDGRWIYFASAQSGGKSVWKIRPQGGDAVRVAAGTHAQESVDGKALFVDDGGFLWNTPLFGSPADRTPLLERSWANGNFRVRKEGIYLLTGQALRFYDFRTKTVRKVFDTPNPTSWGLSVSPDGASALFVQVAPEEADIMLTAALH